MRLVVHYDRPPQLEASFNLNHACSVTYWHLADIEGLPINVRYRG